MAGLFSHHWLTRVAGFQTLNSTTIRFAWTFRLPRTGTLNAAGFRFTAAVTPQTMKASWQDVSAGTMRPDETVDQFRTFTPAVGWITTGLITSDGTDTGAKRSVTKGDLICLVVEWDSTTGSVQLQPYSNLNEHWTPGAWINTRSSAGAWSGAGNLTAPNFAVQYDDGIWHPIHGVYPNSADGTHTYNSGSAPDEIGLRFVAPFTGARLAGVQLRLDNDGAFDLKLYTSADVLLSTTPVNDTNARPITSLESTYVELKDAVDLTGGATYRLTLTPSSGSNVALLYVDQAAAAIMNAMPMGGNCYQTHRTNAGAWTDTTTRRPLMNLIWDDNVPPATVEVTFRPDDLAPIGLVWLEAYLDNGV